MDNYEQEEKVEFEYLDKTINFLKSEIMKGNALISNRKHNIIGSRRDMWENTAHHSADFEKMTEVNQHLIEVTNQTNSYLNILNMIEKYEKIVEAPYFGRFDFTEEGFTAIEKIYIGLHNVMDLNTNNIYVYDWRAPISSIFYQYELGKSSYKSPVGEVEGEVSLKRQYKIENSILKYFFDCSVSITDDLLKEVLSHNASTKMRNIVETIQREQDIIIRDIDNELMIVQGVAGSGKTSIALHRIAFLLYYGTNSSLGSNNIIIVSPNSVFSKYISSVLPELGEENVCQITFDDIIYKHFNSKLVVEKRSMQLEHLIIQENKNEFNFKRDCIDFKGSDKFVCILKRLIKHYERKIIPIEDIYYDGQMIETKQNLKNLLLNNKINTPLCKRLKRIENRILDKVHPMQKKQLERIKNIVGKGGEHQLEVNSFSRLLSIKEIKKLMCRLHKFTEVDYFGLYKILFMNDELLIKLSKGLNLPGNIKLIISETRKNLEEGIINYEDCGPLLYIKLTIEGSNYFSDIKQVVIDEAQDYYPVQYEVFKLLFPNSKYTVLGDINQTIEKDTDISIYDSIEEIFEKRKSVKLSLNKSYRSSIEINCFNQKLLNRANNFVSFERHEEVPIIIGKDNDKALDNTIAQDIKEFLDMGFESIAVICKTQIEAENICERLIGLTNISLVNSMKPEIDKGVWVIPSYISKGLEFDVVLAYGVSKQNYNSEFDRKLLYIACTRALHRLRLYYVGERSPLLK